MPATIRYAQLTAIKAITVNLDLFFSRDVNSRMIFRLQTNPARCRVEKTIRPRMKLTSNGLSRNDDVKSKAESDTKDRVAPQVRHGNPVISWNRHAGIRLRTSRYNPAVTRNNNTIAPQII